MHTGHDVALADPVAVADLGVVRQVGRAGRSAAVGEVEQQAEAVLGELDLAVEGLGQHAGLADLAHQGRPDQLAVAHHDVLVGAVTRIVELEELVAVEFGALHTHRRDIDAGDLQLGGRPRTLVGGFGIRAGEVLGQHHGLLPHRRDEPVQLAAVLCALADRVHRTLVLAAHLVIDDDAAFDHQSTRAGQLGVRTDSGGDDDHVGGEGAAVREGDTGHAPLLVPEHRVGPDRGVHTHAQRLDLRAQYRSAALVELLVHQVAGGVHDVHRQPLGAQPVGSLEPEQTAADDHRGDVVLGLRHLQHAVRVGDGAESEHAPREPSVGLSQAVHVREEGVAPGRDDQNVIVDLAAALAGHGLREAVEPDGAVAGVQRHAVLPVPAHRVEDQVLVVGARLARQHVREHDPVVVAVRLVADHRDVELVAAASGEDLLHRAGTGHSVADHNQSSHQSTTCPEVRDGLAGVPVHAAQEPPCARHGLEGAALR
ncbi:nitrite reductase (NAD(P)H), large subunit domain protein [Rhodococcus sp. MTM3W5.2]|nr:nitrite reductase (NAD(P)H), large subunit domain protein [Rhodococcus sp. MTM3W5.2]